MVAFVKERQERVANVWEKNDGNTCNLQSRLYVGAYSFSHDNLRCILVQPNDAILYHYNETH